MVALLATWLWAHENHAPLPTKGVTVQGNQLLLSARGRDAIGMTTAKVVLADLDRAVEVNAQVELPWSQQAMVTSLVDGRVEEVLARPGQAVRRGQALARVTSPDLERLQADLIQARHEAQLARQRLDQVAALEGSGSVPGKNRLEAEVSLARVTARQETARQKLLALGLDPRLLDGVIESGRPVARFTVTSPGDGVITHLDLRAGQVIKTTEHLAHVVNLDTVWVVGDVPEADVAGLAPGQAITASFAACPAKTLTGTIDHLRLKVDPRKRTQSLVMAVDNRDGLLRPGMFGRAAARVQAVPQAVVCPTDALLEGRQGVAVLKEGRDGRLTHQPVKVGLVDGPRAEILDGLFPGDRVVVVGNFLLASLLGSEHKARTPEPSANLRESAAESEHREDRVTAQAAVEVPVERQAFAGPRLEGRVRRILAGPSQAVAAGQVLAEVESLRLRTTQLELLEASARLALTKDSLARIEPLRARGAVPQAQVWQLQADLLTYEQSVANLGRALAHLGLTGEQLQALRSHDIVRDGGSPPIVAAVPMRAPAGGRVVAVDVVPGQVVHPEQSLFEIQDASRVWLRGHVFEADAPRLRVGQDARARFVAFPGLEVTGKVVRVSPLLDARERVLPFWVEVDNPGEKLREGMLATVTVQTGPALAGTPASRGEAGDARPR